MAAAAAAAAVEDPSTFHPSIRPSIAADRLPTDIISNIQRSLPLVDYLRFPAVCTAWRSAARDRQTLPHLPRGAPWLFIKSYCRTAIYAIDCLTNPSAPKAYRLPLPDRLRGHRLVSSTGHHLLLEKRGSLAGILLFDPFSSSTQAAPLPPSASLMEPPTTSLTPYRIHTIVADTNSGIAVALLQLGDCRLAYARIHRNADNPDNKWFNLTHLIPDDGRHISFGSAVLYNHGLFCLVDLTGTMVFALDLSSALDPKLSDITFNLPDNSSPAYEEADWCCYQSASLVTSGSSIFLVRWRHTLNKDVVKKRREIDIYRLGDDAWVPVNSLGDRSFFIDHNNQSISMSTADFPELKSNRVYLALDATVRIAGDNDECPYDGDGEGGIGYHLVYDLGDESWGVFYDDDFQDYPPHFSLWMIPRVA